MRAARSVRMADPVTRAAAAHAQLKQSAKVLEVSAVEQTDSADRRTELAADRTILAAERTYAAWVRTGLAALVTGAGARALLKDVVVDWLSLATAEMLILFGAFCFLAAVWREMAPSVRPPKPRAKRIPAWMLTVINGFLVLVSLAAMVGVAIAK